MKTAYLIHGTSLASDDWFPWLKKMADQRLDCDLEIIKLPNPFSPAPNQWDAACDQAIREKDGIVIVAHSLGCIEALRFVEQHAVTNVSLILVSGFDEPVETYPQLNSFADHTFNYQQAILPKIRHAVVMTAKDDPIIKTEHTQRLAKHLNAKLIVKPHGGHFLGADGYTKLPVVLDELAKLV